MLKMSKLRNDVRLFNSVNKTITFARKLETVNGNFLHLPLNLLIMLRHCSTIALH